MSGVDLGTVERTMRVLVDRMPQQLVYHDPADGQRHAISAQALSSRNGYLPAVVNAGEAVWREATGMGFELDIARDPDALLGYQLRGIRSGTFSIVMLASLEALHQVTRGDAVLVNELNAVWAAATARRPVGPPPAAASGGPRP